MRIRKKTPFRLFIFVSAFLLATTNPLMYALGVTESEAQSELEDANVYLVTATRQYHETAAEVERVDSHIAEVEKEIQELNRNFDETNKAMNNRLKTIYKYSDFSALELILGSADFDDFSQRMELLSRLAFSDSRLMKTASENKAILESKKAELAAERANRLAALADLGGKTRDIENQVREKHEALAAAQAAAQSPGNPVAEPAEPAHLDRPLSGRSETGDASYYYYTGGYTAAHKTLPYGTMVRVTNLRNGAQVWVEIVDRGPWGPGRVIDLEEVAFAAISDLGAGVIPVMIEW
ncbi:MAG: RlpA-like double-psi beta-barrel domain-containing protein [Actinomycetota bacterium]